MWIGLDTAGIVQLPVVMPRHQTWVNVADCSVQHNGEVYDVGDLPASATYPGDEQVNKLVKPRCVAALIPFSGSSNSKLGTFVTRAGKDAWDAQICGYACLAVNGDNVTGSMADTG